MEPALTIEVLHDRNPDFPCGVRVWVVDVDPGAGYDRETWDESTQGIVDSTEMSESFKAAALEAREDAGESVYIDD